MSKKRKTKKQKVQASTRHSFPNVLTFGNRQISIAAAPITSSNISPTNLAQTHDYTYVTFDVRKTLIITSLLLVLNVVVYFLLKFAIITIPGIVF